MADLDPQTQRILRDLARAHASTATTREAVGKVQSYFPPGSLASDLLEAMDTLPYSRQARAAQAQATALQARLDSVDAQGLRRRPLKVRARPKIDPARDARVQREIAPDSAAETVTERRMAVVVSTLSERLEPLGLLVAVQQEQAAEIKALRADLAASDDRETQRDRRDKFMVKVAVISACGTVLAIPVTVAVTLLASG